ncbi:type-1 angiotensin II receptor-like [Eleutherodactylus coqui]|uniref:type-1 angiotensin II receptor-like n=1 Tax=Eleutherodactylus coqui TaxID=57060 RepID=UPI003462F961
MLLCNTSAETDQKPSSNSIKSIAACSLMSLVFLIGAPGNIMVMWSIYRKLKNISATVLLIVNLALADFLILLSLPIWIYTFAVNKWIFGVVFCKVLLSFIYYNLAVSLFLITLLSIERFLAVFRPFDLQRWTKQGVFKKITISVWIVAAVISLHSFPFCKPNQSINPFHCILYEYTSDTPKVIYLLLEFFFGFLIPFCIIFICYTYLWRKLRKMKFVGKRKSDKIIVLVVVTFIICWIPWQIFKIMEIISIFLHTCSLKEIGNIGVYISAPFVFINSSMNPVLYFYYAFKIKRPTIKRLNMLFENIGGIQEEQNPVENRNAAVSTHNDCIPTVDIDVQMA